MIVDEDPDIGLRDGIGLASLPRLRGKGGRRRHGRGKEEEQADRKGGLHAGFQGTK